MLVKKGYYSICFETRILVYNKLFCIINTVLFEKNTSLDKFKVKFSYNSIINVSFKFFFILVKLQDSFFK